MKRHLISLAIVAAFGVLAYGSSGDNDAETAVAPPASIAQTQLQAIPKDVTYKVIKEEKLLRIKRSLDIMLNRKVTRETLRAIAHELRSSDVQGYERTFIVYYVPGMIIGAGAWATTHFNPDLEVRIQGLTIAREQEMRKKVPEDPSRKVIGVWLDDRPFVGIKLVIYRKKKKFFLDYADETGSTLIGEFARKRTKKGTRFEEKGGNAFGEFFLIDGQGNLQMWGENGHFYTAKKTE